MTATFKVVEFYRINNNNNKSNSNNNNTLINDTSTTNNHDESQANYIINNSKLLTKSIPTTLVASFNLIYDSLGFNVVGGYSTDIPATIVDVAASTNGKAVKVEEGDVILEINGVSTRHSTLGEIYKQLRCCGNRVLLKLKSDPEFKIQLNELLKEQNRIYPTENTTPISPNKDLNTNRVIGTYHSLTSSKSYDNNINSRAQTESVDHAETNLISHSTTSSNISSVNNSHTNLPDPTVVVAHSTNESEHLITDSFNKLAVQSFNYNNDQRKKTELEALNKKETPTALSIEVPGQISQALSCSSSPSSSSSLPINSNDLYSGSSESSSSSTTSSTIVNQKDIAEPVDPPPILDNHQQQPQMSENDQATLATTPVMTFQVDIDDQIKKKIDEKLKECSDSDSDSDYNVYTPKAVDLPSAQRLAKRLYYLDGFKANDVVRHLSKKNDFNQLVADEYLKLFNFQSLTLDCALRKFLKQFQLVGDAQEKERVLMYFAKRFVDANNTTFQDVDSCHTLTCAIMLLNTDLHDVKIQNKMTLTEFVENLKGLNNGLNFSDVLLESLYSAIKNEPLECASLENEDGTYDGGGLTNGSCNFSLRPIGSNPFLQIPDPQTATEYKFGWLLRKCCIDSDGKKAPFLKRSWKMFYASLRDMVLYLHKDDKVFKNNTFDNITNAIRIHHAYASVATDYKKKQFVFRLKTADWAEYLFQTSNSSELYDWVGTINLIAAMFSSPPLPGGIGSNKTFQRPLLPVSKTRYTIQEQFEYHKKHVKQLQCDLTKIESTNGASHLHIKDSEKFFDKDKYNYLQFEIQRYTVYSNILEEKLISDSSNAAQLSQLNLINPSFILNDQTNHVNNNLNHEFHSILPVSQNHGHNSQHHTSQTSVMQQLCNSQDSSSSTPSTPTLSNGTNRGHVNFNMNSVEVPSVYVTPTTNMINNKKFNNTYLD